MTNRVFKNEGLTLLKFKDEEHRKKYEAGDKRNRPENIYLPHAWFFSTHPYTPEKRWNEGVKVFSEKGILDPLIHKSRYLYALIKTDKQTEIKGLS